ncbi:MAG TPA: cell wall synthesis protein CwsA [Mycobacterium sp.]|nr:cell wall synthesis protein CwsA [Mycobacterium sp.]
MAIESRLTPRERLTRGLQYTAVGPVDITRGTVGLSAHGLQSAGSALRRRYRESRVAQELSAAQDTIARDLAAAQEVVANLPQAFQDARQPKHNRRRLALFAALGVGLLAGGAVAFSIVRRSMQKEPSPRPPSVDVESRP